VDIEEGVYRKSTMTMILTERLNIKDLLKSWQSSIDREGEDLLAMELIVRTPFQPEPVVGHRKISLLKLYQRVMDLGGYDWVTESKGTLSFPKIRN